MHCLLYRLFFRYKQCYQVKRLLCVLAVLLATLTYTVFDSYAMANDNSDYNLMQCIQLDRGINGYSSYKHIEIKSLQSTILDESNICSAVGEIYYLVTNVGNLPINNIKITANISGHTIPISKDNLYILISNDGQNPQTQSHVDFNYHIEEDSIYIQLQQDFTLEPMQSIRMILRIPEAYIIQNLHLTVYAKDTCNNTHTDEISPSQYPFAPNLEFNVDHASNNLESYNSHYQQMYILNVKNADSFPIYKVKPYVISGYSINGGSIHYLQDIDLSYVSNNINPTNTSHTIEDELSILQPGENKSFLFSHNIKGEVCAPSWHFMLLSHHCTMPNTNTLVPLPNKYLNSFRYSDKQRQHKYNIDISQHITHINTIPDSNATGVNILISIENKGHDVHNIALHNIIPKGYTLSQHHDHKSEISILRKEEKLKYPVQIHNDNNNVVYIKYQDSATGASTLRRGDILELSLTAIWVGDSYNITKPHTNKVKVTGKNSCGNAWQSEFHTAEIPPTFPVAAFKVEYNYSKLAHSMELPVRISVQNIGDIPIKQLRMSVSPDVIVTDNSDHIICSDTTESSGQSCIIHLHNPIYKDETTKFVIHLSKQEPPQRNVSTTLRFYSHTSDTSEDLPPEDVFLYEKEFIISSIFVRQWISGTSSTEEIYPSQAAMLDLEVTWDSENLSELTNNIIIRQIIPSDIIIRHVYSTGLSNADYTISQSDNGDNVITWRLSSSYIMTSFSARVEITTPQTPNITFKHYAEVEYTSRIANDKSIISYIQSIPENITLSDKVPIIPSINIGNLDTDRVIDKNNLLYQDETYYLKMSFTNTTNKSIFASNISMSYPSWVNFHNAHNDNYDNDNNNIVDDINEVGRIVEYDNRLNILSFFPYKPNTQSDVFESLFIPPNSTWTWTSIFSITDDAPYGAHTDFHMSGRFFNMESIYNHATFFPINYTVNSGTPDIFGSISATTNYSLPQSTEIIPVKEGDIVTSSITINFPKNRFNNVRMTADIPPNFTSHTIEHISFSPYIQCNKMLTPYINEQQEKIIWELNDCHSTKNMQHATITFTSLVQEPISNMQPASVGNSTLFSIAPMIQYGDKSSFHIEPAYFRFTGQYITTTYDTSDAIYSPDGTISNISLIFHNIGNHSNSGFLIYIDNKEESILLCQDVLLKHKHHFSESTNNSSVCGNNLFISPGSISPEDKSIVDLSVKIRSDAIYSENIIHLVIEKYINGKSIKKIVDIVLDKQSPQAPSVLDTEVVHTVLPDNILPIPVEFRLPNTARDYDTKLIIHARIKDHVNPLNIINYSPEIVHSSITGDNYIADALLEILGGNIDKNAIRLEKLEDGTSSFILTIKADDISKVLGSRPLYEHSFIWTLHMKMSGWQHPQYPIGTNINIKSSMLSNQNKIETQWYNIAEILTPYIEFAATANSKNNFPNDIVLINAAFCNKGNTDIRSITFDLKTDEILKLNFEDSYVINTEGKQTSGISRKVLTPDTSRISINIDLSPLLPSECIYIKLPIKVKDTVPEKDFGSPGMVKIDNVMYISSGNVLESITTHSQDTISVHIPIANFIIYSKSISIIESHYNNIVHPLSVQVPETLNNIHKMKISASSSLLNWDIFIDSNMDGFVDNADIPLTNNEINVSPGDTLKILLTTSIPAKHVTSSIMDTSIVNISLLSPNGQTLTSSYKYDVISEDQHLTSIHSIREVAKDRNCNGKLEDETIHDALFETGKKLLPGECAIVRIIFSYNKTLSLENVIIRDKVYDSFEYIPNSARFISTPSNMFKSTVDFIDHEIIWRYAGKIQRGDNGIVLYHIKASP